MAGKPSGSTLRRRRDAYAGAVVDGRLLRGGFADRARLGLQRALTRRSERDEAQLDAALAQRPEITRSNTIAVVSPHGGVGKTTCTFLIGSLLADRLSARCLAVDADPDHGTLAALVPEVRRSSRSIADLRRDADAVNSTAELLPYVSSLASGLHVLAAPADGDPLDADAYGELLPFLARFYEVVLLDLGASLDDHIGRLAAQRADQTVLVGGPGRMPEPTTPATLRVLNQAQGPDGDADVVIPCSDRLRTMLDSATYTLGSLDRATRMPIKRLGAAAADGLV
jgi:cellulose biosynthesis protein BcsQ